MTSPRNVNRFGKLTEPSSLPEWEELEPYIGKWVAILDRQVVAYGISAAEVYPGNEGAILYRVMDPENDFASWLFDAR